MVDTVVCRMKWTFSGWAPPSVCVATPLAPQHTSVRIATELDRSFMYVRDAPVNLDESIYALVPVAADSAAVMKENNATLIDSLRVSTRNNTKNPTLTVISIFSKLS